MQDNLKGTQSRLNLALDIKFKLKDSILPAMLKRVNRYDLGFIIGLDELSPAYS